MKIGIVGARRRDSAWDRYIVFDLVKWLTKNRDDLVLVSGGCLQGADAFCKEAAKFYGIKLIEHLPVKAESFSYRDRVQAFHARNKLIAENSEELYALIAKDRRGGTENTIGWMEKFGKGHLVRLLW